MSKKPKKPEPLSMPMPPVPGGCLMCVLTLGLWPLLMRSPKR